MDGNRLRNLALSRSLTLDAVKLLLLLHKALYSFANM